MYSDCHNFYVMFELQYGIYALLLFHDKHVFLIGIPCVIILLKLKPVPLNLTTLDLLFILLLHKAYKTIHVVSCRNPIVRIFFGGTIIPF
jgi:hypothetical protein